MKRIVRIIPIILSVALLTAFTLPRKTKKVTVHFFEGTFKEALAASKQQNKPIFIDSYTQSCKWCKKMDRTTFRNRSVVNYLNSNFINIKMDMRSNEGKQLKAKYEIDALPTLLFVNSSGKPLARLNGFADASTFLRKAKKAKRKHNR